MSNIQYKIEHFEKLGFNVVSFKTYKSMLNQIGYDINITYAKQWGTYNSWDGVSYIATKCFYLGSNIAYCNIEGDHLKNEKQYDSLQNIRKQYCFYFGENIYIV